MSKTEKPSIDRSDLSIKQNSEFVLNYLQRLTARRLPFLYAGLDTNGHSGIVLARRNEESIRRADPHSCLALIEFSDDDLYLPIKTFLDHFLIRPEHKAGYVYSLDAVISAARKVKFDLSQIKVKQLEDKTLLLKCPDDIAPAPVCYGNPIQSYFTVARLGAILNRTIKALDTSTLSVDIPVSLDDSAQSILQVTLAKDAAPHGFLRRNITLPALQGFDFFTPKNAVTTKKTEPDIEFTNVIRFWKVDDVETCAGGVFTSNGVKAVVGREYAHLL